jgi:hypothetical protein
MRNRNDFPAWLTHCKFSTMIEVGVCRGEFSDLVLSNWNGHLSMVDAWQHFDNGYRDIANADKEEHESNLMLANRVASRFAPRARIVRGVSPYVASQFEDASVDVVYLDANHSYEAVKEELAAWRSKIKPGGAYAGHDFLDAELPTGSFGVRRAVLEYFGRLPNIVTNEYYATWVYYL